MCFELAVTEGAPDQGDSATAAAALHAVHHDRDRTAIEVLNHYLANPQVLAKLERQLQRSWTDVCADDTITGPFLAGLTTVLGPAEGHTASVARQRVWTALIADATPYNLGALARTDHSRSAVVDRGPGAGRPGCRCSHRPVSASAGGDRPLDRSVVDRVRATLRRALDRDELPDVPLLCAEEVDRACAPWGFLGEDKQATLVAGIEVGSRAGSARRSRRRALPAGRDHSGQAAQGGLRAARQARARR